MKLALFLALAGLALSSCKMLEIPPACSNAVFIIVSHSVVVFRDCAQKDPPPKKSWAPIVRYSAVQ